MDYDIVPPPPSVDARNAAGGLLNRFDGANMQVKILCVGMYNTGKSTFLNRWQTNLKVKTRTTINVDFYERHVDGYFPVLLQESPDPSLIEQGDGASSSAANPPSTAAANRWACVDFPIGSTSGGRSVPVPQQPSTNFLSQPSLAGGRVSQSSSQTDLTECAEGGGSLVAGTPLARHGSYQQQRSGSGLLPQLSAESPLAPEAGGSADAWNPVTPTAIASTGANNFGGGGDGIANKHYRNPRLFESSPNVLRALRRATEAAKKARASGDSTDRFTVLCRGTQRRPIAEVEGAQITSVYSITREMGLNSGAGRFTAELYGMSQLLADSRRTVRDPRQVLASAMNTNFGYTYYEKRPLHVQCWDIQGQEHSRNMSRTYYTDAMAALVFVDAGRPESLADAVLWREDIVAKVFVKTATDASIEAANLQQQQQQQSASAAMSRQRARRTNMQPPSVVGRAANSAAANVLPSPFAGSGASYDREEEAQIPCWLVINKCDLLDPKTHQFPSRDSWDAQTGGAYKDLDDFCEKTGFIGWSFASATQNINVNGIMERVIQQCCNQFPREIHRFSTRGKQSMLQLPKPRPKQQKKCCGSIAK